MSTLTYETIGCFLVRSDHVAAALSGRTWTTEEERQALLMEVADELLRPLPKTDR